MDLSNFNGFSTSVAPTLSRTFQLLVFSYCRFQLGVTLQFKNIFAWRTYLEISDDNDFRPFLRPRNPAIISKWGSVWLVVS